MALQIPTGMKTELQEILIFFNIRIKRGLVTLRHGNVTHGLAKLLTFYFTARDRPLSKPHGPWSAGVGGP